MRPNFTQYKSEHDESPLMIRVIRICRKCGAKIFSDAPRGLCTGCMLETALGIFPNAVATAEEHSGAENVQADNANAPADGKTTMPTATLLGEFGDYELLEEIGRGGQGVVFRARQKSLNRIVALKVIGLGQWASKAHLKRFRREAEAAASLEHPGTVPIHEVGERDGSCYFSMKFVEGGQLDEVVKRSPMSTRRAAELIAKVARTVHYAHEHGILHRDLKPGNILLDPKGEPHLTDFGLARLVESESSVTQTLDVLGTPSYMAPEQAAGNNTAVSSNTDVYGLGAVLYQLLTGQPPFAGGTTYETIKLLLDTEPRQPRLLNPKIDRDLSTICLKCLEKDPNRRYSSALALAEDLERWLKHEPIEARRTGIFARGTKWVRRNPTSALLVACLVALAVAAGWIAWKSEFIRHPVVTSGVAVLPFDNLSPDPNNAYFAQGIQDEILTRLASIADLKVISRTSTAKYKSKPEDLKTVSQQLGVATVLEGSVQKAADKVRVNVQLIDAQADSHLWARSYDRDIKDVFAVESEVAQEIADSLQAKLSPAEAKTLAATPTKDTVAYDLFLRAEHEERLAENSLSPESYEQAAAWYQQAIARDPNFALAMARLVRNRMDRHWFLEQMTDAELAQVHSMAEHAIALAPTLAEAHVALGNYFYHGYRQYEQALTEFERALQLQPNAATAVEYSGYVHRRQGQWARCLDEFKRALEEDPRNALLAGNVAATYVTLRMWKEAERAAQHTLELDPRSAEGMRALLDGFVRGSGDVTEAQRVLATFPAENKILLTADFGDVSNVMGARAYVFVLSRDFKAALKGWEAAGSTAIDQRH